MNYKKRDDELIKLNKQAREKNKSYNVGNNSSNVGYTNKAFESRRKLPVVTNSPNKATTQANAPVNNKKSVDLKDKGYSSSTKNDKIDFDYVLKNDKYWGNRGMSVGALDVDSDYRRKMGRADNAEDNAKYYQRFGMSKNEVLDQYDKYKREKHPILTSLEEDFRSAPDRALLGAAGMAAHQMFPESDLDKFVNSDLVQHKVKDVQKKRDYVYDSDKLTERQKQITKGAVETGDLFSNLLFNILVGGTALAPQVLTSTTTGAKMATVGTKALGQTFPKLMQLGNGVSSYGLMSQNAKHDLERQGIDSETASNYGNAEGLIWGGIDALTAGAGSKIGKGAAATGKVLPSVLKGMGIGGGMGITRQGLSELANKLILDDQANYNRDIQNYTSQGMTEDEAKQKAFTNILGRVGQSGLWGMILGGASELVSQGLNRSVNPTVNQGVPSAGPSAGAEYFNEATPNGYTYNNRPLLTQVDALPDNGTQIPSIEGMMPLGLPKKQLPSDAIRMPGTQGVINLPGQTEPIYLPDTQVQSNVVPIETGRKNNPRVVNPLNEEQRAVAQSNLDAIKTEKKLMQEELDGYKNKNRLTKEQKARRDLLKERIKEHTKNETILSHQLKGKGMSVKDILKNASYQLYSSIYGGGKNWKGDNNTFAKIDNIVKFAGNTPEAKELGKQIKKGIDDLLETGKSSAIFSDGPDPSNTGVFFAMNTLDAMAKAKEAEGYIPFGDYSYSDRYGDIYANLFDDIYKVGEIGSYLNKMFPMPQAETQSRVPKFETMDENKLTFIDDSMIDQIRNEVSNDTGESAPEIPNVVEESAPVQRSYKELLPENPFFESDSYRNLSENINQIETEKENLKNTKKQLSELVKNEIIGEKSKDEYTPDDALMSLFWGSHKPLKYSPEGERLNKAIANIDERLEELNVREREIGDSQRSIKDKTREAQLQNYQYSDPVKATQSEYPGFDLTKGSNGYAQEAIDNGTAFMAEMSPLEYLQRSAYDIFDTSALENTIESSNGINRLAEYVDAMRRGEKFPIPYLNYGGTRMGSRSQEGRTRALAAYEAGLDRIPVSIIGQPSANPNNVPTLRELSNDFEIPDDVLLADTTNFTMRDVPINNMFDLDLQFFAKGQEPNGGYWLRLLGDSDFLQQEAQKNNVTPDVLRQYANYNLGYDETPKNNAPKQDAKPDNSYWTKVLSDDSFLQTEAQKHNVTPDVLRDYANMNLGNTTNNGGGKRRSFFDDIPKGRGSKTSQTYTNTGKRGGGWNEEEYNKYTDPSMYQYETIDEETSVKEATQMRQKEGRENFKNRVFEKERMTSVEIDGLMMEWRELTEEARTLEASGQDASALWSESNKVFRKIREQETLNAQAVQALAKWSRNTPEGMLVEAENIVNGKTKPKKPELQAQLDKFLKKNKKFEFSEDFIKDFLNEAESLRGLHGSQLDTYYSRVKMAELGRKIARQIPSTFGEKLTAYLMDNMLGNFRTLITRNAGGNIGLNAIEQLLERPLAAGIDTLVSKKTGKRTQAGLTREGLMDYINGFAKGLQDEADDMRRGLHTARTGENTLERAIHANRHVFGEGRGITGNTVLGRTLDRFDGLVKNGLSVGDRPFYEATYKQTLDDYYNLRNKMGSDVQKLNDEQFKQYATTAARLNALAAVYQNDTKMSNALLGLKESIGELSRGMLGFDILSQFSMPFVKTPANVVNTGISYSPLGFVRNAYNTAKEIHNPDLEFDQNRFVNDTARNIIGTGLFGAGVGMAAKGLMSGALSDDKDEKQAQVEAGEQEYALNLPNGTQIDIGWSPVSGSDLVAAAAFYDAYKNGEGTMGQNLLEGLYAGGKAQFDQAMFQGAQRLFGSGETYDPDKGIVGNMVNVVKSGASQAIPSLARQAGQVIDPYQRDLAGSNKDWSFGPLDNYDINSITKTIPFLRETLAPKVNTSGELLKENQGRNVVSKFVEDMILPGKVTKVDYSNLSQEAINLQKETGNNIAYMPKVSRKDVDTEDYTLSNQEWVDHQQKYYNELTEAGTKLVESDFYKDADAATKEKALSDIYGGLRQAINSEYNGKNVTEKTGKVYLEAGGGEEGINAVIDYYETKHKVDTLNEKYGTNVKVDTYEKKEAEEPGSGEEYMKASEETKKLNEKYGYNMQVDTYIKHEGEKKGGAEEYIKEASQKKNGTKSTTTTTNAKPTVTETKQPSPRPHPIGSNSNTTTSTTSNKNVDMSDYDKQIARAGKQSRKFENDLPVLVGMGAKEPETYTYAYAINQDPSLNVKTYHDTYTKLNYDGANAVSQQDMIDYFNANNLNEQQGMYYWTTYGEKGGKPWKKLPRLTNGTWKK